MSDLLSLASQVLDQARGNEQLEVYVSTGSENEVVVYDGAIEDLTSASSSGIGIRVLVDGAQGARVGTAWSGSLDDEAIRLALAEARDNAQFATEDEFLAFARPDGVAPATLTLTDEGVHTTSMDDKVAMALELEQMVRRGDARIRQVDQASYSDYAARAAILSTTGIRAEYARTGAYVSVSAIASDGDEDQTGWGLSAGRAPHELVIADAAADAIRRSTRMLGATKAPSAKLTAVFDPRTAATLFGIIAGSLSGEAVVRGRSLFANRLGETVGSSQITLIDDPTDPRHFSATPYDGEGLATRRNVLIENGVLRQFVYDTVSARRAGTVSTGSAQRGGIAGSPSAGCRAVQLVPGTMSQGEILAAVGEGILVESIMGVHSGVNPISGDFSVGITGIMIRNGQLCEPVREVTIASTLQRMLLDVLYVGADQEWLPGSVAGQTVAVANVALSGS